MATQPEPDIVLYDLMCNKNECFSPAVWRTRLMLNYKNISYRTIFLEFPDIKPTLEGLGLDPNESGKYTVPTIQHIPTNKYIMDSDAISKFIEETYPNPPLELASELGDKLKAQIWTELSKTFRASIMPREADILYPRSAKYFRNMVGLSSDNPIDVDKEEEAWMAVDGNMRDLGEAMRTNRAEGPFILGAVPTYADFVITGAIHSGRMVDEGVFQRIVKHPGFRDVYEACQPYMEKRT